MRHKILIPTDFSKNASNALRYAMKLYENDDCDFYLLNVFSATSNILQSLLNLEPGSELYETAKLDSATGLAKVYDMVAMYDDYNPKHNFKTVSVFNNIVDAIKNIVEQKDIEIIIMGTQGETYSRDTAFGSTATYVMEKIRNCPVLVVPLVAKLILPKEIVFPTGYKTHYKKRELEYLIDIANKSDATVIVLYISEESGLDQEQLENKQLLEEILDGINYNFRTISHNAIETAVSIFVESRDSDMVAFINKKHAFFGSILTSPLVKNISFHSKVPILAMHDLNN